MTFDHVLLTRLKDSKGLSHAEIATRAKVSRPLAIGWCKGTVTPDLAQITRLAAVLGVPSDLLIIKD